MRLRWWLYFGAVLLAGAALAWAASSGPDPFPTHWGAAGTPDAWQSRGTALTMLAVVWGGVALLFGSLAAFAPRLPDAAINLPTRAARAYWLSPEHRPALNAVMQRSMLLIGGGVQLLLAVSVAGATAGTDASSVVGVATAALLLVSVAAVAHLIWTLVRMPGRTT